MMSVPVKYIEDRVDPLNNPPWDNFAGVINVKEVLTAANRSKLQKPKTFNPRGDGKTESRTDHINRIAYYVKFGWGDTPIFLLLKDDPSWGSPLMDGYHRSCAAIIRGDDMILAEVLGPRHLIREIYEFEEKLLQKAS